MTTPLGSASEGPSSEFSSLSLDMKDVTSASLDAWFVLREIARASDNSIVLRGSTKKHIIPVALKCHATMSNDARQMVAQEPLTYEILVYDHAVTAVSAPDFFVSSLGTVRRQWYFEDSAVSAEGLGPADTALLRWMLRFTYPSIDELNEGATILVMRDHGPTSVWRYFSRKRRDDILHLSLAAFVVQIISALDVMAAHGIVHGDLRWENILYPRVEELTYFDLTTRRYEKEWSNFSCVPVRRVVKVFDWDHAFFSHMPFDAKKKAQYSFQASEHTNMNSVYDTLGFLRLLYHHFPGVLLDAADTKDMEPAFTKYAYQDPRDGAILQQASDGACRWQNIERVEEAVQAAKKTVYDRAAACLVTERRRRTTEAFELATEGGEMMRVVELMRTPRVHDLDHTSLETLREAARASRGYPEGPCYDKALDFLSGILRS